MMSLLLYSALPLEKPIMDFFKANGIKDVDKDSADYTKICHEIYKAAIAISPLELKGFKGDFSWNYDLPTLFPSAYSNADHQPVCAVQTSVTVKQATEDYWDEYTDDLKSRSETDYKGIIKQIVTYFGPNLANNLSDLYGYDLDSGSFRDKDQQNTEIDY